MSSQTAEPDVVVVVEIPAGSRNKYEIDPDTGHVFFDRRLSTSVRYPAEYGYVPGTLGDDGDPLDALVLTSEPTVPGCRIRARVLGAFEMSDDSGHDTKLLCVAIGDPAFEAMEAVADIGPLADEIEHFFTVYKDLDAHRWSKTDGWVDRAEALATLERCRRSAGE